MIWGYKDPLWFAWYPVKLKDGRRAWLTVVKRTRHYRWEFSWNEYEEVAA